MTDKQDHQVSSPLPTNPHLSLSIIKQNKSWTSAQSNMPISKTMHAPPITKRHNGSQNSLNTYALGNSSSSVTTRTSVSVLTMTSKQHSKITTQTQFLMFLSLQIMNSIDTASNNTLLVLSRRQMVMYFYVKWKRIVIICYVTTQCLVLAAVKRQQPLSDTIYSLIILQRGYIYFI